MTAVHPIARAWISTGGTGAPNYDEFADDGEITAVIAANPRSALAVEMPHMSPESDAQTFAGALPQAAARLHAAQDDGAYRPHRDVVAAYRITAGDGTRSTGLFAMVATDEISTNAQEPGQVIRNEDVFLSKVRQRVALIDACDHLLSAVLLVQTQGASDFAALLGRVCAEAGKPDVIDHDAGGRVHEVWVVSEPGLVARLCALAGAGDLVVADGNHRSLAAQQAGLERFMAVITTAADLALLPYQRLIASWPAELGPLDEALRAAGADVALIEGPVETPPTAGVVHIYAAGQGYAVRLPRPKRPSSPAAGGTKRGGAVVESMDHTLVEQVLFAQILGWDAGDERITYVGGDYSAEWLCAAVDDGRAAAAVLIAPVSVDDFVAVNVDRAAMPRKSTWFVPKARAGLVLADLR
ncbi:MAG: DUF1015 family protein [Ornithinimicrobium sp.]